MITIIDSGGANIASIQFALERLGVAAQLSHQADVIKKSSYLILPGVGSAESAMRHLNNRGLIPVIRSLTQPVLGICLGMQLLFDYSAEGNVACLGLVPGKISKITPSNDSLTVPHMGWNTLQITQNNALMRNIANHSYVYFVHSYAAPVGKYATAITHYGNPFAAAVQHHNFYGTQFHPERSSIAGSRLLKNFLEL